MEGNITKQRFYADDHHPIEDPITNFTNVHKITDIIDNNIGASKTIQDETKIDSFEEITRNWNIEILVLNNKVDELSEEITRLTHENKRFCNFWSLSKQMKMKILPLKHSTIVSIRK